MNQAILFIYELSLNLPRAPFFLRRIATAKAKRIRNAPEQYRTTAPGFTMFVDDDGGVKDRDRPAFFPLRPPLREL